MTISSVPIPHFLRCGAFALLAAAGVQANATIVQFQTSLGNFEVNLYDEATPETVANFLAYLKAGTYENTFFHRSVKGFVVQGGGFVVQEDNSLAPNPNPLSPINEPVYSNVAGTIVMAKVGNDVNGATNQWFFNLGDNSANLDVQNGGFTVFGEVMGDGMEVLAEIEAVQTYNLSARFGGAFGQLPLRDYTTQTADALVAAPADYLVMVHAVTVLDAAEDTAADLDPPLNVLLGQQPPPPQPAKPRKKSGSIGLLELMLGLTAGAGLALRRKCCQG